ncbi:MAG TPA: hypothetical protein VEF04_12215 [Blastocatellia bacterium]|nr:hypothetical protein [Blastocatellia bacterium]
MPDVAKIPIQPKLIQREGGHVYSGLTTLSRITCPGPEQTRLSRNWFTTPIKETGTSPAAAEGPVTQADIGRIKTVAVRIPTIELPPPVIIPAIKPSWEPRDVEDTSFQWGSAIRQSMRFLAIQHAFRLATEGQTRADLKGPFFKDYFETLTKLRGWTDGDPFIVNYIGHPMMGAVSGYIQIQNDPRGIKQEVGFNKDYFKSRLKAFGWSALYSTQFELGPISEASLGNVGIRPTKVSKHPMGYVDIVVTPVVGTMWLVGEDALDKYVVMPIENRVNNKVVRILVRSFLNPSRSMANVLRSKWPWYRDGRKLQ